MISDEAVEAAARVFYHLQPNGTPLIREREQARAALEAALPHLLEGKRDAIRDIVEAAMDSAIPEPWEVSNHATNRIIALIASAPNPTKEA